MSVSSVAPPASPQVPDLLNRRVQGKALNIFGIAETFDPETGKYLVRLEKTPKVVLPISKESLIEAPLGGSSGAASAPSSGSTLTATLGAHGLSGASPQTPAAKNSAIGQSPKGGIRGPGVAATPHPNLIGSSADRGSPKSGFRRDAPSSSVVPGPSSMGSNPCLIGSSADSPASGRRSPKSGPREGWSHQVQGQSGILALPASTGSRRRGGGGSGSDRSRSPPVDGGAPGVGGAKPFRPPRLGGPGTPYQFAPKPSSPRRG